MDESKMIIPIENLVNNTGNIYEVTNAAISRSRQLSKTGSKDLDDNLGKIVSISIIILINIYILMTKNIWK